MKQLPHKPGLYMAQDDSIWLFDGDYFSLIRKDKSFPGYRVYGIQKVRPHQSRIGMFVPRPLYSAETNRDTTVPPTSRLYYSTVEYRLVAAALTPVSNTSKKACLQPESAWVSENIVERTRRSNAATMIS